MLKVFCIPTLSLSDFLASEKNLLKGLTPKQVKDVQKYTKANSRQHSLLGTLLAKWLIRQKLSLPFQAIEFNKGKNGKPFYPDSENIQFNISHAGRWVVAAMGSKAVGIDIEKTRSPQYRIAKRYFSKEEQEDLFALPEPERQNYFFDLWTLKESYLKLLGKGLTQSLSTFTIRKSGQGFILLEKGSPKPEVHLFSTKFDNNYTLSVSSLQPLKTESIQNILVKQIIDAL